MSGRHRHPALLRRAVSIIGAIGLALAVPAVALAHPLGNFTINTYAGIRVSTTEIDLDLVLDQAEIPTFQERLRLDRDGDGELSDAEIAAARTPECRSLAPSISLTVAGKPVIPELISTGLSFPAGAGGLPTMRLVCELRAPLPTPLVWATSISFENRAHTERIGWREIVVQGDGTSIASSGDDELRSESLSQRLSAYPTDLLAQPLSESSVAFVASPGGSSMAPFVAPDAQPLTSAAVSSAPPALASSTPEVSVPQAAVPGGVGAEVPAVFRTADLSPGIVLLALATALALGAGHALTPGHGKTLMAAYLVGTRGTAIHAAGLGLSVTVSHTLGILALAVLVVAAQGLLPPDVVVRFMPTVAAVTIAGIGCWMLISEVRRRRRRAAVLAGAHERDHDHEHEHEHEQTHDHDHGHDHDRPNEAVHHHDDHDAGEHSHGGIRHSHAPSAGTSITWRSLFLLGLAGGIIPSTNALLILLGTIAAGRTAFGVILVVAFGIGMAVVLGGVGLALVYARGRLDRFSPGSTLGRVSSAAPLVASIVVLVLGVFLTGQAFLGRSVL
jgi:nickel/cobalt exporter